LRDDTSRDHSENVSKEVLFECLKFDTRTDNSYVTRPTKHKIGDCEIELQCGKTDRTH